MSEPIQGATPADGRPEGQNQFRQFIESIKQFFAGPNKVYSIALVIMGLASVVSFVLATTGSAEIGIFGIILCIACMFLLLLFKRAADLPSTRSLGLLVEVVSWSIMVLFIFTLTMMLGSFFYCGKISCFSPPPPLAPPPVGSSIIRFEVLDEDQAYSENSGRRTDFYIRNIVQKRDGSEIRYNDIGSVLIPVFAIFTKPQEIERGRFEVLITLREVIDGGESFRQILSATATSETWWQGNKISCKNRTSGRVEVVAGHGDFCSDWWISNLYSYWMPE